MFLHQYGDPSYTFLPIEENFFYICQYEYQYHYSYFQLFRDTISSHRLSVQMENYLNY